MSGSWNNRICNFHYKSDTCDHERPRKCRVIDIEEAWGQACAAVQWRPQRILPSVIAAPSDPVYADPPFRSCPPGGCGDPVACGQSMSCGRCDAEDRGDARRKGTFHELPVLRTTL